MRAIGIILLIVGVIIGVSFAKTDIGDKPVLGDIGFLASNSIYLQKKDAKNTKLAWSIGFLITGSFIILVSLIKKEDDGEIKVVEIETQHESSSTKVSFINKYDYLGIIGSLFERGLLSKEYFELEKSKLLAITDKNYKTDKYNKLDKIGNLFDKKVITIDEYKEELLAILDEKEFLIELNINPLTKKDSLSKDDVVLIKAINDQIIEASDSLFGELDEKLISMLSSICSNRPCMESLISKYYIEYDKNLIEMVDKITSNYSKKSKYLQVFIDYGMVETEPPYNLINSDSKNCSL